MGGVLPDIRLWNANCEWIGRVQLQTLARVKQRDERETLMPVKTTQQPWYCITSTYSGPAISRYAIGSTKTARRTEGTVEASKHFVCETALHSRTDHEPTSLLCDEAIEMHEEQHDSYRPGDAAKGQPAAGLQR
ncbi:hypothetical protein DL770_007267 [Monosporascus sp. CRB-9-2]|nr:hypothetical protein DL770_007267 [Monosporascus sp. CRB-9-2]